MTNSLLRSLAALLCVLSVCADVTPAADFDVTRVNGRWYLVGFATNAPWFVNNKAGMKTGIAVMVPTAEADLQVAHTHLNADGSCWRMSHVASKTATPGKFFFHSEAWGNDNDMIFTDVQYAEHAVVYNVKTKDGVSEVLNKLFSRTPEVGAAVTQRFHQFSLDQGVLADNIVMLPPNGECPEA
ncbi:lipocalin-like [Gadus chalcogrammus]|uniref:lipocalin-like n=1 Tax=Gadus chalcogrammus TaxID=1042646 RepID=UPI0024C4C670|nr:lipocalin-like [Gadus chalcogrammus]